MRGDFDGFRANDGVTFVWEPKTGKTSVSAATTCTGLMALVTANALDKFYSNDKNKKARLAFERVMAADWNSSELPEDNAFTTILVIRTAGLLAAAHVVDASDLSTMRRDAGDKWKGKTLQEIVHAIVDGFPAALSIQEYPPTTAAAYWLVDGIANLGIYISENLLLRIAGWTQQRFMREVSLVSARHDALMDPIALAMSAALIWRLGGPRKPTKALAVRHELPSALEVENGVKAFLGQQLASGLWPKYFPLFHFPEAGANYCWSFEVLEALLLEMSHGTFADVGALVDALDRAVTWCEQSRLTYESEDPPRKLTGWNSGGRVVTLAAGKPELWPTAVVHMFAERTSALMSMLIQKQIERKYAADFFGEPSNSRWDDVLDYDLALVGEAGLSSVKTEIETRMVAPILKGVAKPISKSALLFGPPGTSKTTLVKAAAQKLGWAYVGLSPDDFLSDGLPSIYSKATEIFTDLMDLRKTVILFDEMDALARTREEDGGNHPLDVTQQFLTTSMLPKLANLHDHQGVIFFMATNYQSRFDSAIKRPGRFDLLLCVGPPSWQRKVDGIGQFWKTADDREVLPDEIAEIKNLLFGWAPLGSQLAEKLDNFTFGEMRAFFDSVMSDADEKKHHLLRALQKMTEPKFEEKVGIWDSDYIVLREPPEVGTGNEPETELTRYLNDKKVSRRQ